MEGLLGKQQRWQTGAALIRRGIVILAVALGLGGSVQAVTFTAALDRDTITVGESVGLALTFDGAQPQDTPTIPAVPNLQIRYIGPASQVSFVNGQVSSKITHNFSVTPKQVGDYIIPAVGADVNGQRLATQPLRLKVTKPTAPPPDAVAAGNQAAFIRLVVPKTNIFLGEVMMGTFQLYLRDNVDGWGQFQFTATPSEGLSIGKVSEGQRQRVQIGGATFTIVPLNFSIAPIKTGPLSLGPVTASIAATLPPRNQQEMFFGGQRTQINLVTDATLIQCLPVPTENAPVGFNGVVGDYTMTVNIGPTNVATGDPITVRVQISGRGALDAVTVPEQAAWGDFKTYPPTAKVESSDPLGLQGVKTFEQVISPQNADLHELPAFTFSFFNPDTRTFRTLTHPATKLVIHSGGVAVAPSIAVGAKQNSDATPPPLDIVPIKQRLGAVSKTSAPLLSRPVFVVVQTVPLLAFLAAFIWRKRTDSLANNPRLRRQRQVEQVLREGVEKLRALATQNKSDEFFAELVRLLQERLGERLDCPATAITEAVIDEKLRPRGVPDSTLEELHELFQACNLARYAPVRSSQELAAVIPKLESALRKLAEVRL